MCEGRGDAKIEMEIDGVNRGETELLAMIDTGGRCQMGGVMMGNDTSLER